ncbi:MAG: trehalase family glycosidase [Bacteroidota bacterium]
MDNKALLEQAKEVLAKNDTGVFTKPAPNLYPHQWNWDAGFIALGYAQYAPELAKRDLHHLFSAQWPNGMVPQIVFGQEENARYFPGPDFWQTPHFEGKPHSSGITMPPVHGFVLWQLLQNDPKAREDKAFYEEKYHQILASHRYLYKHRDPQKEGLTYVRHPWEPGTDNSPTWDPVLAAMDTQKLTIPSYTRKDLQNPEAAKHRPTDQDYDRYVYLVDLFRRHQYNDEAIQEECPFQIQDPLFNAILTWSNECMAEVGRWLGQDIGVFLDWKEATSSACNSKLWSEEEERYLAYDLYGDRILPCRTSSAFMPLLAGIPSFKQAIRMLKQLQGPGFSGTPENPAYKYPTYDLRSPDVNYEKYWRGPVWINMNWLLWQGLLRYGFTDEATAVRQDSLTLLKEKGLYEYFDPRKGQEADTGYGTGQFSWSAALAACWLAPNHQK